MDSKSSPRPRLVWLQHVPFEGLEMIGPWARLNDYSCQRVRLYANEPLPEAGAFDALIVMGGPMGVHDTEAYPWLTAEKRMIEAAIAEGKTVLGVCLGAQLIADVLGARVRTQAEPEIGWHRVFLSDDGMRSELMGDLPSRFMAFHWHADTFEIPSGARRLALSEACAHQAFAYGSRVLGLQFHLEISRAGIEALLENSGVLQQTRYVQSEAEITARSDRLIKSTWGLMEQILTNLLMPRPLTVGSR